MHSVHQANRRSNLAPCPTPFTLAFKVRSEFRLRNEQTPENVFSEEEPQKGHVDLPKTLQRYFWGGVHPLRSQHTTHPAAAARTAVQAATADPHQAHRTVPPGLATLAHGVGGGERDAAPHQPEVRRRLAADKEVSR